MASRDDDADPSLARFERRSLWIRRIRTWLPSGLVLLVAVLLLLDPLDANEPGAGSRPPGTESAGGWSVLATILLALVPVGAFAWHLLAYRAGPPQASERQELADSVWAEVASAHRGGEADR